jgi:hypothetical protein
MNITQLNSHVVRLLISAIMAMIVVTTAYAATGPMVSHLGTMHTGVRTPVRLAVDSSGNIFAADPRGGGVLKFNPAGNLLRTYATASPAYGVAVRGDGNLIVSQGNFVAIINSSTGAEIARLGSGIGQFQMAGAIAIGPSSQIYVVDSLANDIKYFTSAGVYINTFGGSGSGPGQFSRPSGITFESASGHLAVVDTLNGRVQFFDGSGVYQRSVGSFGSGSGRFTAPRSVAFEYDGANTLSRIYVLDSFQSVIQVLDSSGNPLPLSASQLYIGGYGKESGRLVNPSDLLFDTLGRRLVVANSHGNLTLYGINGGLNPVVTVNTVPQATSSATVSISGTLVPGTTVSVSVDGTPATTTTVGTSWDATVLLPQNGTHRVTVVATDVSGNTTSRYYDIVRATTVTPFEQNATLSMVAHNSTVSSQTQTVSGTVANGIGSVTVQVNSGAPVTVPVVNNSFSVPVTLDAASNLVTVTANGTSTTRTVLFNPAAPAVAIQSPVDGAFSTASSITVTGSSPAGTTVSVLVNGTQQATSWGQTVNLQPGLNTLEIVVTDPASSLAARDKITVNYTPALALSVSSPLRDTATPAAAFTVTGATSAATVRATLYSTASPNGSDIPASIANGTFTVSPELTVDDTYRLAVTSVDSSGTSFTTYRSFVRIATATVFNVTSSSSNSVAGTSNKPGAVVTLRTAGGANVVAPVIAGATGSWSFTGISGYDPRTMFVTASDAAGNSSRTGHITGTGSGPADITDAMKALRIAARLDTPTDNNLLYGDVAPLVNGMPQPDGRIYIDDALLIMRRVVGLPWQ